MKAITITTLAALFATSRIAVAQTGGVPGYSPATAAAQRAIESDVIGRPNADSAGLWSKTLSREAHVAGTPAQARTRDFVLTKMKEWGLETESRTYSVWLPHATAVRVARVSPVPRELDLREPAVALDPTSALPQYLTVNGYSGEGDVTGEVVY